MDSFPVSFFLAPFSGQDVGDNVPAGCKCKEGKDVIRAKRRLNGPVSHVFHDGSRTS